MNWPPPASPSLDKPTPTQVLRRYWWVLAGVAAVIVGLVWSETRDPAADVHPAIVDMVDTLSENGDCASLQAAFDRTDDADELRYIDDALRDTGCYD